MTISVREPLVLWLSGQSWDGVRGSDHRLVDELSQHGTVIWCDPPRAAWHYRRRELAYPVDEVAPNVLRLRIRALPYNSKPGLRHATMRQAWQAIRILLQEVGREPDLQVLASPRMKFVPGVGGTRVFFQTDDWLGGAGLLNLSAGWIECNIRSNVAAAHVLAGVTELLMKEMAEAHPAASGARRMVLANGCYTSGHALGQRCREPVVGLVGQLNERLDLDVIEAIVDAEIPLRIIGPRSDTDRGFAHRLDRIVGAASVEYVGAVSAEEVQDHLARLGAGITPYTLSRFNRASFPLKTLEYLAAGLAVVSTGIPAVHWLDTHHIETRNDAVGFAQATRHAMERRHDIEAERERRVFAERHTWSQRADDLLQHARSTTQGVVFQHPVLTDDSTTT